MFVRIEACTACGAVRKAPDASVPAEVKARLRRACQACGRESATDRCVLCGRPAVAVWHEAGGHDNPYEPICAECLPPYLDPDGCDSTDEGGTR